MADLIMFNNKFTQNQVDNFIESLRNEMLKEDKNKPEIIINWSDGGMCKRESLKESKKRNN